MSGLMGSTWSGVNEKTKASRAIFVPSSLH